MASQAFHHLYNGSGFKYFLTLDPLRLSGTWIIVSL